MKIDLETIQKIAHLARLELTPTEQNEMVASLGSVLDWMEQLNEVDTEGVVPLTHMTQEINAFSEDVAFKTITRAEGLANAPKKDETYFRVPKVM